VNSDFEREKASSPNFLTLHCLQTLVQRVVVTTRTPIHFISRRTVSPQPHGTRAEDTTSLSPRLCVEPPWLRYKKGSPTCQPPHAAIVPRPGKSISPVKFIFPQIPVARCRSPPHIDLPNHLANPKLIHE
jgi:hypothetical protein